MENKNNDYTGIVLCIILALGLGAFWIYSSKSKPVDNALPPITEQKPADNPMVATTTQSGKIDEHLTINNELRDVNFCGKTYKVKQVMIDGVDVVQRIAEIATVSKMPKDATIDISKSVCEDIKFYPATKEGLDFEYTQGIGKGVNISIIGLSFYVPFSDHKIYLINGFDGESSGVIGNLK